jgi:hypothetical protein
LTIAPPSSSEHKRHNCCDRICRLLQRFRVYRSLFEITQMAFSYEEDANLTMVTPVYIESENAIVQEVRKIKLKEAQRRSALLPGAIE